MKPALRRVTFMRRSYYVRLECGHTETLYYNPKHKPVPCWQCGVFRDDE